MSKSKIKKSAAKKFNMNRAEVLAYEMDKKLFPPIKRPSTPSEVRKKVQLMTYLAMASGFLR